MTLLIEAPPLPRAEALAEVVERQAANRDFVEPLEFEHNEYRIREGRRKAVYVFARFPEVVASETDLVVRSSDPEKVKVRGRSRLTPVPGTNYAEGVVSLEGGVLHSKAVLTATVRGYEATAHARIVDKKEDKGPPIRFELRPESFGTYRARWAVDEGRPNLLLISAAHESLSRYLGDPKERWPGQDSPVFRALLAEIIAENVCRKALLMEAQERPFDFSWAEEIKPEVIADAVYAQLQRRLNAFLPTAHEIMLSDQEASRVAEIVSAHVEPATYEAARTS